MPKNSSHEQNYELKKPYTRQPIHRKVKNEEDEDSEEESDSNLHQGSNLYPNISKDLLKLQDKPKTKKDPGKRGINDKPSVIDSGTREKKLEQVHMSGNSDSSSQSSRLMYIFCLLFLIVSVIGGVFICGSPKKSDKINVDELVTKMQNDFKLQNRDVASKILKKALTKVVIENPEPKAPAIFTVLANKGAEKTASDFSINMAKALASDNFVSINESLLWRNNAEELKYNIDTKIRSQLYNGILNVVIVDRLNDIPIDAAIIFHGFCDHENAPFKRAVYLFIVHLERQIPENSKARDIDTIAQRSLRNIWLAASDDLVDSLIVRITANVVSIS